MIKNNIQENILYFKDITRHFNSQLIAVSKNHSENAVLEAYNVGQRHFGENKVQEVVRKQNSLPKDIKWHMIGHLQTNKVKYIAPFIYLIHAVDSLKLLKEINKQAEKNNRKINCLLQVHIAREEHKFGFKIEDLLELLENNVLSQLSFVNIIGLMGMATNTTEKTIIRNEFKLLKEGFSQIKTMKTLPKNVKFQELSMGMTNDYSIALEEGSTLIRIGSAIFGKRK